MSKFKAGDRVRYMRDRSDTATILGVYEDDDLYWVKYDDEVWPVTAAVAYLDPRYELIPEPFLRDGGDRYYIVYVDGPVSVAVAYSSLAAAESSQRTEHRLGIVRIDGQTGALSWAQGGPL